MDAILANRSSDWGQCVSLDLRKELVETGSIMPSANRTTTTPIEPVAEPIAPSDEQLALAVAKHLNRADREAAGEEFMKLYDRHRRMLWAFVAARSSRRDADDIAQEIWQRVWSSLPSRF